MVCTALQFDSYSLDTARVEFSVDWYSLLDSAGWGPDMTPDWQCCTARAQNLMGQTHVWIGKRAGKTVSVLPYLEHITRMYGIPLRLKELPGNTLVSYHQDLLSLESQVDLLRTVLTSGKTVWDVFLAPSLVSGGPSSAALSQLSEEMGWVLLRTQRESSPYMSTSMMWQVFLTSKSSNFRYNLNRKERRLQKAGELVERWFTSADEILELQAAILQIEANSWKVAADMATSDSTIEKNYYQHLLPFLARRQALLANVLYLDGKPIAYSLCYFWQGKVGQMKTSFDEAVSHLSAGLVVNYYAVRKAFEMGASEFDFLGNVMPHKTHWTSTVRQHENYYIFSNRLHAQVIGKLKKFIYARRGNGQQITLGRGAWR